MKILVCVKQVYVPGTDVTIDHSSGWIQYNPTGFRLNSYDEYALEEALLIKERIADTRVHAVSIGPGRTEVAIRRAMEIGADEGIQIRYEKEGYLSPYQTASLISSYAKEKQYDLIMTGVTAEDDMQMQTGQMIAGTLNYPYASSVIKLEMKTEHLVYVERECDAMRRECVELPMPCVLTIQSGINKPRYPALSNVLRTKQQKLMEIPAQDLVMPEAREKIIKVFLPETTARGVFLQGSAKEKAVELLRILHEKAFL